MSILSNKRGDPLKESHREEKGTGQPRDGTEQPEENGELDEEVRLRIVEATVRLHEEKGPVLTSIDDIAREAGVARLTVYRHFPDDYSLFEACSTHWFERNPPPQTSEWESIDNKATRTESALLAWYRYYANTEKMWKSLYRDLEFVDAMREPMGKFEDYLDQSSDNVLEAWNLKGRERSAVSLILRHSLSFLTWQSLKRNRISNEEVAELVLRWIGQPDT